jgi:hypothetical protein
LITSTAMELVFALGLLVVLARIVEEARRRYFPAPHRWKWVLGCVLAAVVGYSGR